MNFILFISVLCGGVAVIVGAAGSIEKEVYFTLFRRNDPTQGISLTVDSELGNDVERNIPWKFFVHGWTTSPKVSPWFDISKNNYFKTGKYNIVYVDWSKPANQSYVLSVLNARGSGEYLGDFLVNLNKKGVPLRQMHILGHSMGSHMAGYAGRRVFDKIADKIYRITATDPAGPLFDSPVLVPESNRIDKGDANFLDVVHTDGGNYGMRTTIGHVDFFPNGGKRFQPGCENETDENCSHARSVYFYAESILSRNFIGREAKSYHHYLKNKFTSDTKAVFGEYLDTSLRGTFYFRTYSHPPYAMG